jgi:hypothetical protein
VGWWMGLVSAVAINLARLQSIGDATQVSLTRLAEMKSGRKLTHVAIMGFETKMRLINIMRNSSPLPRSKISMPLSWRTHSIV